MGVSLSQHIQGFPVLKPGILKTEVQNIMLKFMWFLLALGLLVGRGVQEFRVGYQYNRDIDSYWTLGVKASTLQQKSTYLDQYIKALEDAHLSGNDAIIFPTPDNSYEQNMVALKSLQGRMHQIQGMDEQSFAYQTAIQQITGQEQAQADNITGTFEGIWYKTNHIFFWGWIDLLMWALTLLFAAIIIVPIVTS